MKCEKCGLEKSKESKAVAKKMLQLFNRCFKDMKQAVKNADKLEELSYFEDEFHTDVESGMVDFISTIKQET